MQKMIYFFDSGSKCDTIKSPIKYNKTIDNKNFQLINLDSSDKENVIATEATRPPKKLIE